MAWCNYISKLLIFCVVCRRCFLLWRSSMAAVCSVCVVLLRLDGVVHINCDSCLLYIVGGLVLLAAVFIVLVCDWVLRAGALFLTIGLACACRLLRNFFLVIIWLLSGRSSCAILDVFSTLGTAVGGTLGSSGVSLAIFIVTHLSLFYNGFNVLVCGSGFADLEMASLFLTDSSVSFRNCCISSDPSFLPMFLIDLVQSAMEAIILSAWVMVGFVIFWWLNWAVSVKLSLLVVLMWHICVR